MHDEDVAQSLTDRIRERVIGGGDVRFSEVKRVAAAVGEGSMAIKFADQYLKDSETQLDQ